MHMLLLCTSTQTWDKKWTLKKISGGEHWSYQTPSGLGHSLQVLRMQEVRMSLWSHVFWAGSSVCPSWEISENSVAFLRHYQVCQQSNTHTARTENLDVLGAMPDARRNSTRICSWEEGGNRNGATAVAQTLWVWKAVLGWTHGCSYIKDCSKWLRAGAWSCHAEQSLTPVMEPEGSRNTGFSVLYNVKCRGIWEMRL